MQRAALARALACDASYLLMDEPFAALDHFTRQTMQKEFLRICAEEKMGALFVTHSVDEALLLGDEILIMENGKVGSRFTIGENLAYPRDLLSEEMIGIKRKIIKTLENRSQTQKKLLKPKHKKTGGNEDEKMECLCSSSAGSSGNFRRMRC